MNSEYTEPTPDPNANDRRPSSELWGTWEIADEDTQAQRAMPAASKMPSQPQNEAVDPQAPYREHVTSPLPTFPPAAPSVQAVYPPSSPLAQGQVYAPQQSGSGYPPPGPASQVPRPGAAYPAPPGNVGAQFIAPLGTGAGSQEAPHYPVPYPGYPGSSAYPGYPAYPPGYQPYPYPAYAWGPPPPKRDRYLFAVAISSVVGSSIALLAGLGSALLLVFLLVLPQNVLRENERQLFAATVQFIAFAGAGILGGTFGLYHSIRSLLKKPSANFSLPRFWIFLVLYLVVLGVGFLLHVTGQEVTVPALTIFLIVLAALFPALTLVAIGVRRLRPRFMAGEKGKSPTTWRRFAVALISGGTSGIFLALVLELLLAGLLSLGERIVNINQYLNDPSAPAPQDPAVLNLILILVVVIAPIVEELVKPLGVVVLIGQITSAAEAFLLGLAAGIGFDLVETAGYISFGYRDWLNVALERTGTGLLHGFGSAMAALGWYYITRPSKDRRVLLALGCWLYAVVQHAIWNGSATLALLPAPIGPLINSWNLNLGFTTLSLTVILNIIEAVLFLAFFIYVTGKLSIRMISPSPGGQKS